MVPDLFNHFSKYNIMKHYYDKIIRDIMNGRSRKFSCRVIVLFRIIDRVLQDSFEGAHYRSRQSAKQLVPCH